MVTLRDRVSKIAGPDARWWGFLSSGSAACFTGREGVAGADWGGGGGGVRGGGGEERSGGEGERV